MRWYNQNYIVVSAVACIISLSESYAWDYILINVHIFQTYLTYSKYWERTVYTRLANMLKTFIYENCFLIVKLKSNVTTYIACNIGLS